MADRGRPKTIWDKYPHIVVPVLDDTGAVIAGRFIHERGKEISAAHGMSNIHQHLATSYYIMLDEDDQSRWRPRRKWARVDSGQCALSFGETPLIDQAAVLAKGCAMGCLPLDLPRNPGFQYIMSQYVPGVVLPSRRSVSRKVDTFFDVNRSEFREKLREYRNSSYGPVKFSLTGDMWTSGSRRGFLGANLYVIDKDFQMHALALACRHFPYPHTGPRIAEKMKEVLLDHGLFPAEVNAITTDNESAAVGGSRLLAGELTAVLTCSCHSLNLCGQDAARTTLFSAALSKIMAVVNYFSGVKKLEALEKKQDEHRFIEPAPTRWNYAADVVERGVTNGPTVAALTENDLDLKTQTEKDEWNTLKAECATAVVALSPLVELLKRLVASINALSAAQRVTVSQIFKVALELYDKANALTTFNSSATREFAEECRGRAVLQGANSTTYQLCRISGSSNGRGLHANFK